MVPFVFTTGACSKPGGGGAAAACTATMPLPATNTAPLGNSSNASFIVTTCPLSTKFSCVSSGIACSFQPVLGTLWDHDRERAALFLGCCARAFGPTVCAAHPGGKTCGQIEVRDQRQIASGEGVAIQWSRRRFVDRDVRLAQ